MKAADTRKLLEFEMGCYRRILKVCWKDMITNNSIRDKVHRNFTVVDIIKQKKLQLFWPYVSYARQKTDKNSHAGHGRSVPT